MDATTGNDQEEDERDLAQEGDSWPNSNVSAPLVELAEATPVVPGSLADQAMAMASNLVTGDAGSDEQARRARVRHAFQVFKRELGLFAPPGDIGVIVRAFQEFRERHPDLAQITPGEMLAEFRRIDPPAPPRENTNVSVISDKDRWVSEEMRRLEILAMLRERLWLSLNMTPSVEGFVEAIRAAGYQGDISEMDLDLAYQLRRNPEGVRHMLRERWEIDHLVHQVPEDDRNSFDVQNGAALANVMAQMESQAIAAGVSFQGEHTAASIRQEMRDRLGVDRESSSPVDAVPPRQELYERMHNAFLEVAQTRGMNQAAAIVRAHEFNMRRAMAEHVPHFVRLSEIQHPLIGQAEEMEAYRRQLEQERDLPGPPRPEIRVYREDTDRDHEDYGDEPVGIFPGSEPGTISIRPLSEGQRFMGHPGQTLSATHQPSIIVPENSVYVATDIFPRRSLEGVAADPDPRDLPIGPRVADGNTRQHYTTLGRGVFFPGGPPPHPSDRRIHMGHTTHYGPQAQQVDSMGRSIRDFQTTHYPNAVRVQEQMGWNQAPVMTVHPSMTQPRSHTRIIQMRFPLDEEEARERLESFITPVEVEEDARRTEPAGRREGTRSESILVRPESGIHPIGPALRWTFGRDGEIELTPDPESSLAPVEEGVRWQPEGQRGDPLSGFLPDGPRFQSADNPWEAFLGPRPDLPPGVGYTPYGTRTVPVVAAANTVNRVRTRAGELIRARNLIGFVLGTTIHNVLTVDEADRETLKQLVSNLVTRVTTVHLHPALLRLACEAVQDFIVERILPASSIGEERREIYSRSDLERALIERGIADPETFRIEMLYPPVDGQEAPTDLARAHEERFRCARNLIGYMLTSGISATTVREVREFGIDAVRVMVRLLMCHSPVLTRIEAGCQTILEFLENHVHVTFSDSVLYSQENYSRDRLAELLRRHEIVDDGIPIDCLFPVSIREEPVTSSPLPPRASQVRSHEERCRRARNLIGIVLERTPVVLIHIELMRAPLAPGAQDEIRRRCSDHASRLIGLFETASSTADFDRACEETDVFTSPALGVHIDGVRDLYSQAELNRLIRENRVRGEEWDVSVLFPGGPLPPADPRVSQVRSHEERCRRSRNLIGYMMDMLDEALQFVPREVREIGLESVRTVLHLFRHVPGYRDRFDEECQTMREFIQNHFGVTFSDTDLNSEEMYSRDRLADLIRARVGEGYPIDCLFPRDPNPNPGPNPPLVPLHPRGGRGRTRVSGPDGSFRDRGAPAAAVVEPMRMFNNRPAAIWKHYHVENDSGNTEEPISPGVKRYRYKSIHFHCQGDAEPKWWEFLDGPLSVIGYEDGWFKSEIEGDEDVMVPDALLRAYLLAYDLDKRYEGNPNRAEVTSQINPWKAITYVGECFISASQNPVFLDGGIQEESLDAAMEAITAKMLFLYPQICTALKFQVLADVVARQLIERSAHGVSEKLKEAMNPQNDPYVDDRRFGIGIIRSVMDKLLLECPFPSELNVGWGHGMPIATGFLYSRDTGRLELTWTTQSRYWASPFPDNFSERVFPVRPAIRAKHCSSDIFWDVEFSWNLNEIPDPSAREKILTTCQAIVKRNDKYRSIEEKKFKRGLRDCVVNLISANGGDVEKALVFAREGAGNWRGKLIEREIERLINPGGEFYENTRAIVACQLAKGANLTRIRRKVNAASDGLRFPGKMEAWGFIKEAFGDDTANRLFEEDSFWALCTLDYKGYRQFKFGVSREYVRVKENAKDMAQHLGIPVLDIKRIVNAIVKEGKYPGADWKQIQSVFGQPLDLIEEERGALPSVSDVPFTSFEAAEKVLVSLRELTFNGAPRSACLTAWAPKIKEDRIGADLEEEEEECDKAEVFCEKAGMDPQVGKSILSRISERLEDMLAVEPGPEPVIEGPIPQQASLSTYCEDD